MSSKGGLKLGCLPLPVDHIWAGYVDKGIRLPILRALPRMTQDVVHMVGAIAVNGCIGVAGRTVTTGVHKVVVEDKLFGYRGI